MDTINEWLAGFVAFEQIKHFCYDAKLYAATRSNDSTERLQRGH